MRVPATKKLRGDSAAMSEIVGALMLTLVVVVAATSFAVFVAEKQKAVQEQELYNLWKSQESIRIVDFKQNYTKDGSKYWDLNFTLTSNHARETRVSKISVNGHVASKFHVWRVNQSSVSWEGRLLSWSDDFRIQPKEQLYLRINSTCLFETNVHFINGTFVKLEVFTVLLNSFTRVFMPPNALLTVKSETLWNSTSGKFEPTIVLDGSASQAQEGSFLTMYQWKVTRISDGSYDILSGVKASYRFPTSSERYYVNLTVMDDHGLMGSDSIIYYA